MHSECHISLKSAKNRPRNSIFFLPISLLIWNFCTKLQRCITTGFKPNLRDHHDVATTILIENCLFSEIRNIGLLCAKVRRFCLKSTDVLCKEVRCFGIPVLLRVEDVSTFFLSPPQKKKFFENLLHFLHPVWKILINSGIFGCRFGCRIKCRV